MAQETRSAHDDKKSPETTLLEKLVKLLEDRTPAPQPRINVDELQVRVLDELRGKGREGPKCEVLRGCRSEDTGASFDAEIQGGKVTTLLNYAEPEGVTKHVSEGGLVPDGISIVKEGDNWDYRTWLWTSYWQADLKRFVGKPLPPSARPRIAA